MATKRKAAAKKSTGKEGESQSLADFLAAIPPEFLNNKQPKNIKTSVRGKYNRRCDWLVHAMEQLRTAAENVLAQNGKIYKADQAKAVLKGIKDFGDATGLKYVEPPPPSKEELDHFQKILENGKPWQPSPAVDTIKFYEKWGFVVSDGLRERAKKEADKAKKAKVKKKS